MVALPDQPDAGYCRIVDAALTLSQASLDGAADGERPATATTDQATRDAARAFLRSEFTRWSNAAEPDPTGQDDGTQG